MRAERGLAVLLISHDLGSVARLADRVAVMYAGRIVEEGPVRAVLSAPRHPYTAGLIALAPRLDSPRRPRAPIPGSPPAPGEAGPGCAFAPRCPARRAECDAARPARRPAGPGAAGGLRADPSRGRRPRSGPGVSSAPLLEVRDLVCVFGGRGGQAPVRALDGLDLTVGAGEIVGLVGESGCGKSTLARIVVGLLPAGSGTITVDGGADVRGATGGERARLRRTVQIVFQDPYLSLNPRLRVGTSIAEPLAVHGVPEGSWRERGRERRRRVAELLESVGLPAGVAAQRPGELSGRARQRVAIARALALRPRLLVLDEPISSLDPSIGAQVMALLSEPDRREGLADPPISHDLATVRGVAARVAVMDAGRIVEEGPAERILSAPASARARALVEAAQALSPPPWAWPGSTVQA